MVVDNQQFPKVCALEGCRIHDSCKIYGASTLGKNCIISENVILGYPSSKILTEVHSKKLRIEEHFFEGVTIGNNATILPNATIYGDVSIKDNLRTGHNVLVREKTTVGDNVLIGTNVVIDGNTTIGSDVSIQSNAYIPANTTVEDAVFLGPCAVLTNDKYPIRVEYDLKGPVLRKGASLGANVTVLPGIEVGEGAMVGAGALVTKDVPAWKLAIGVPATIVNLPEKLRTYNRI